MKDQSTDSKAAAPVSSSTAAPEPTSRSFWRWARQRWAGLLSAGLLAVMGLQMLATISRKTITIDETIHIPAGYYYLVSGDFQINNEHPPLAKMWAALPLLLIQPSEPPPILDENENYKNRTWSFHQKFWELNRARFEAISFWTRAMMIALTLALGALIFFYARKLFGPIAALFAVALFTLEPTFLAHGRIVHTDVPAALMYLLFFVALHGYIERRTLRRALLLAVVTSVAVLTKFSLLVILPVLALVMIFFMIKAVRKREGQAAVLRDAVLLAVIVLVMVNLAYRFQHPALAPADSSWVQAKSASHFGEITSGIRGLSKVVPTYYLFGLYNVAIHNQYGHHASLLGRYSEMGWWYYFPVAFALKTTIPFLLIAVTSVAWALWNLLARRQKRFLFLLVPLAIYSVMAMSSHLNIGIRYFLPAYPFLLILGGALLARLSALRSKPAGVVLVILLFGWMTFESVRTFPNYLPYMNQFASSHPHWWYLSDSNVEWGDDVGELARYLKAHGETRVRGAIAGGPITLTQYQIEYADLLATRGPLPAARYTAVGAAVLNGSVVPDDEEAMSGRTPGELASFFASYRARQPEAVFGNTIYLFREPE